MASPKPEIFFLFNASTGAPVTDATGLTFTHYKNEAGTDVTPQPTISSFGGNAYGFTPSFVADHCIHYTINTNGNSPAYVSRFMRPEDYNADNVDVLVSSRLATSGYTAPDNATVATTGATVASRLDVAVSTRLATSGYTAPDNTNIGNVWTRVNNNLDTPVSSRLASSSYVVPDNATLVGLAGDVGTVRANTTNMLTGLDRLLGLSFENTVQDQHNYDGNGNLLSSRLRIYDSAEHASAGGSTGLIATFLQEATYALGRPNLFRVTNQAISDSTFNTSEIILVTQKILNGTAAPGSGTWAVGDIVFNTNPAAGGVLGWVCTAAGTPGTWKEFGLISL